MFDNVYINRFGGNEVTWLKTRLVNFYYCITSSKINPYTKADIIFNIKHGYELGGNHSFLQRVSNFR